jgi:hypothetical protein
MTSVRLTSKTEKLSLDITSITGWETLERRLSELIMNTKKDSAHQLKYKNAKTTTLVSQTVSGALSLGHVLEKRNITYGDFETQGDIAQNLKQIVRELWDELEPDQREALDMIMNKISRILNGSPNVVDSWDDIAGYALLISNRLRREVQHETSPR